MERWERSVHRAALVAGDLSAPTCPRCHGSHGAAPPGVESVSAVCGQCHAQNMQLFRGSPHQAAFEAAALGACEACHSNHEILRPDDTWVGVQEGAVCARCHVADDGGGRAAAAIGASLGRATALLREAETRVEAARARGMLMLDAQVALDEARQQVVQARTLVHAAHPSQVEERTGLAAVGARRALELASSAFAEIRYRRAGLLVALVVILVATIALLLKIHEVDLTVRSFTSSTKTAFGYPVVMSLPCPSPSSTSVPLLSLPASFGKAVSPCTRTVTSPPCSVTSHWYVAPSPFPGHVLMLPGVATMFQVPVISCANAEAGPSATQRTTGSIWQLFMRSPHAGSEARVHIHSSGW